MLNGAMPSLADIAAVTKGTGGDDGFGGNNGWWVLVILFALFGGWGRNGYGNGDSGSSGGGSGVGGEIQRGFDTQSIISKLDGVANGISSLGYDQLAQMNNLGTTIMQGNFGLQQALNNMAATNAQCCCENKTGQMQIMNQMGSDTCAITNAINQAVQNIMQNDNNNYQRLHDEQVQIIMNQKDEKIQEQASLIQSLNLRASQVDQTSDIVNQVINQLRNCPVGTYNVSNPNCCNNQNQIDNALYLASFLANKNFNNGCNCNQQCNGNW